MLVLILRWHTEHTQIQLWCCLPFIDHSHVQCTWICTENKAELSFPGPWYFLGAFRLHSPKTGDQVYVVLPQFQGQKLGENPRIHSRNLLQESKWIHINFSVFQTKGPFILHCNCVAVLIYWLLSAASRCSITAFWVKMNLTFMRHRNAVTLQFLCSAATQCDCGVVWTDL